MSTATTQPFFVNNHQHASIMESSSVPAKSNLKPHCSPCLQRFIELRNQAIHSMTMEYQKIWTGRGIPAFDSLHHIVYQTLRLSDHNLVGTVNGKCLYCDVHIEILKKKALEVVQTQFNPFLRNMIPYNHDTNSEQHLIERQMMSRGETTDSVNGQRVPGVNNTVGNSRDATSQQQQQQYHDGKSRKSDQSTSRSSASPTPASQFFSEAAKMYKIPSKKKQGPTSSSSSLNKTKLTKQKSEDLFPTNFSHILHNTPPSNPPGLFKYMGRRVDGKVAVMLRIQQPSDLEQSDSFIEVDQRKRQISVLQPKASDALPNGQQNSQPKLFAFDQIFESELSQNRVSSGSLLDVLHAVINGGDGALVTYGGPSTGKTHTMVGEDNCSTTAGVLPCAISWLYSLIDDCKHRTGARISVRVSAVEVVGKNENLKDLLFDQASGADSSDSSGASPGIYLREDPLGGSIQIGNVSEPQSATAEKAGFYLDAALASRTAEKDNHGHVQRSHMIFTFHIYQYRVEKNVRRGPGGAVPYSGGRSRLHLIDLSYVNQNFEDKTSTAPSHAALGQIIIAMLNGNKKVQMFRDSKISRLLRDSIGNPTCRATLIAHVSVEEKQYRKTLQTLSITSKIARTRRKRNKNCSSSSDNTSCDESKQRIRLANPQILTKCLDENNCSDYNTSSAGEDSCDTVIYNGSGHMSDRDLTDNERPPSPDTMKIMKLKLASSSEDETTEPVDAQTEKESSHSKTVKDLHAKLSSMEESEEPKNSQIPPPDVTNKVVSINSERVVNVVAPLVVEKEVCNVDRPTSPNIDIPISSSTELGKASLIDQLVNNRNANEIVLVPPQIYDLEYDNVSEKSLRKQEKRIEKLLNLASSMSEDESYVDTHNKRNNSYDGYTSDHCHNGRCKTSSKLDGYTSAPEYNHHGRSKPIQAVKGRVRKQLSLDEHIEPCFEKDTIDETDKETCLDEVIQTVNHSTPKQTESPRLTKESLDKLPMTVSKFSSIREPSDDPPADVKTKEPETTIVTEVECELSETNDNNINKTDTGTGKLQNLDHIITVTPIPNFSVTKKPSLTQLTQSPSIKPNSTRTPLTPIENSTSLDSTDGLCSPKLERSYSREDTISLVSAYDSDAYESDAYSSYGASPALAQRGQRRPTRLRYRWSTVYEEAAEEKKEKQGVSNKSSKKRDGPTVVDSEAKPSRIITSPKSSTKNNHGNSSSRLSLVSRFTKSPKTEKKYSNSETPKGSKKYFSSSRSEPPLSPKGKSKFGLLSPRSERKSKKSHSPDKRMSGCSDASSGIDSGIQSQTSSLRSGEEIKVDDRVIVVEKEITHSSKHRLWPFGRSKSRKSSRSLSGYASDSHVTDSTRSRRSRLFGSRSSKFSLNTEGYCSGYETSVTEGGMTSCAEDYTDSESVSGSKKKKRFLGFRRRSTNDLSQSRTRVKKPAWFDSRRCQSDDEGMQITKVYHIDDPPRDMNKRRAKSEDVMSPRSAKRIEGLRKHREHLKSELRLALDIFPNVDYNAQLSKLNIHALKPEPQDPRLVHYEPNTQSDEQMHVNYLEKENADYRGKLKVLRNHIQVVTCFDGSNRKVTQI